MNNNKEEVEFWGKETGKEVVNVTWKGIKTIGLVVIGAAALGLGLGAMDSAAG